MKTQEEQEQEAAAAAAAAAAVLQSRARRLVQRVLERSATQWRPGQYTLPARSLCAHAAVLRWNSVCP